VELRTIKLPDQPPPGWLLLRVEACGICGTDLTEAVRRADWAPFGHEIAGVVEAVGHGVEHLPPGMRVALESASFCGRCELCRNGRVDLCNRAPNFWGQAAMGFSQFMLAPACCAVPYESLEPDEACLAEPAGVAYDLVKVADIRLGDKVCVVGPGSLGLMAVVLAQRSGAQVVHCLGRTPGHRLRVACDLGAVTVASTAWDRVPMLHRFFDHVLLTAPVQFIPPALALLAYEGRLTYIGIGPGDGTISFDANDFHFRKLQLRASFASPAVYFPRVLGLLRADILPAQKFISHRFALADIGAALALLRDRKDETVKVVITP
jgi:L-iditol 2-dehydrogenase